MLNYGDTPGKKNQCLNDKIYKDVTEKEDSELFKLVVVPDVVVTVYALHKRIIPIHNTTVCRNINNVALKLKVTQYLGANITHGQ